MFDHVPKLSSFQTRRLKVCVSTRFTFLRNGTTTSHSSRGKAAELVWMWMGATKTMSSATTADQALLFYCRDRFPNSALKTCRNSFRALPFLLTVPTFDQFEHNYQIFFSRKYISFDSVIIFIMNDTQIPLNVFPLFKIIRSPLRKQVFHVSNSVYSSVVRALF